MIRNAFQYGLLLAVLFVFSAQNLFAATLESTAFSNGGNIPTVYTGDGQDISPPLSWTGIGTSAQELALICEDISGLNFTHWVVYGISPTLTGLPENVAKQASVTSPAVLQGPNDYPGTGWGGPLPPAGESHTYRFTLYVLNAPLNLAAGATKAQVLAAVSGKTLETATLNGVYYPSTSGGTGGAPALNVTKIQTKLSTKTNLSKVSVNGFLPNLTSVSPDQKQVTVNIGGLAQTFTLDSKGKAKVGNSSIAIKTKPSGSNGIGVKLVLADVDAATAWGIDLNLELVDVTIAAQLTLDGQTHTDNVMLHYKGKSGRGGVVKGD